MTESEGRALARTATVLLVASAIRWGTSLRSGPPVVPPDSATALPALLEESRRQREEEERRRAPLGEGEKLDPNRATDVDLDRLPGVGPATARAIVEGRGAGGYARPEDLLRVRGIGEATLRRILPHIDLSRPPPGIPVARRLRPGAGRTAAPPPPGPFVSGPDPLGGPAGSPIPGPAGPRDPPVDLNSADRAALESLPGVGPAIAGRILEERERRGGFRTVDDLLDVRGIGPATLERLRPRVVVRR